MDLWRKEADGTRHLSTQSCLHETLSHPVLQRLVLWREAKWDSGRMSNICCACSQKSQQAELPVCQRTPTFHTTMSKMSLISWWSFLKDQKWLSRNSNNIDSLRKRWRGCIAPSKSSFLLLCTEQGAQKAEKERQKKKSLTTNHTYTTIFCCATQQQHVTPNSHKSWHSAQRLLVRRMLTLAP